MKRCGERKQYSIPLPTKLVQHLGNKSCRNVLDIGCGYGRACFFLREQGYAVIGVDVDRDQVSSAVKEAAARNIGGIEFLVNDASVLCFPDSSFDAITVLGVLTLVSERKRPLIINEAHRVLKPSGILFVEEFGRSWENRVYARRYRKDFGISGEMGTFLVKDENGNLLHFAHHFTRQELFSLLQRFRILSFEKDVFTSYYHGNWVKGFIIMAQKQV